MSDPASLTERELALLANLTQLSEERAKAESSTRSGYAANTAAVEKEYQDSKQAVETRFTTDSEQEERAYQKTKHAILTEYKNGKATEDTDYEDTKRSITGRCKSGCKAAKKHHDEARWEAGTVYEAAKDGAKKRFEKASRQLAEKKGAFAPTDQEAKHLLALYGKLLPAGAAEPSATAPETDDDPNARLDEAIERASDLRTRLAKLTLPKLIQWGNYIALLVVLIAALAYPAFMIFGKLVPALEAAAGAAVVLWVALRFWLASVARKQVGRVGPGLAQTLAEVEAWTIRCQDKAKATLQRVKTESEQRRDTEVKRAEETLAARTSELETKRDADLSALEAKHAAESSAMQTRRDDALRKLEEQHAQKVAEINARHEKDARHVEETHDRGVHTSKANYEKLYGAMTDKWQQGMAQVKSEIESITTECRQLFTEWTPEFSSVWQPAKKIPSGIRFGEFQVDLQQIPYGIARDEKLRAMAPEQFTLPAVLPFPTRGSLLLKAIGAGRETAVHTLQAVMLRCMTALPPGKVRFTIIDPVGLGQNFSAFMHLADFDEQMVNSRIWTEPSHIEQRLTDLTDHMENVIQKYLRNEFETIEQYNINAGEVAEPFRFLVVANFPVNFGDQAARRLLSIASSGARCGVYTLISVDMHQQLPQGFTLKDLERHAVSLMWREDKFVWRGSEFEPYPLTVDTPPPPELFTPILQDAGARAKEASKVEVPFDFIAPADDNWWTCSASEGIDVPLGRAGATRLQHLKLGKGTSQHVLIAGRTGSGKSTLLHALITNLSLHYSPEEVELYLIDFKKGVEFKTYAMHELPHARVVAIESEREFGLSVLQRLDAELKYRGDKFREVGAQDLNAYRQANGNAPTPRILLIVDEFQEFFVEDDKVAQEAALLLDRLVRQGRAFGIHVHLGSQTLSGAYSLARSTLGQMAVRIALQCSEADAHLILSEENSAARLLSRPGEAIYNDANGLIEGNHPFQVVWLADDRKEDYLTRIQALARARKFVAPQPQLVFEGNAPADPVKNPLLERLLESPSWPEQPRVAHAWLGEAIAIKDPTAAVFRPQSGSNVLVIGQQDEAAMGIMVTTLIGLAAQYPAANVQANGGPGAPGARFYLFDGSAADSPLAGYLNKLVDLVPHPVQLVGMRELPTVIDEIATEVERRQASAEGEATAIYLLIYDLQRFRDLRKAEDDYSFGRMGEEAKPSPAKQFVNILREGPPLGVHTIVWCDTLNNVNRTFDRQALREFEMRVLFQMSNNDSSALIDSPAANRLGQNRALYSSEEEGRLEKFRPYGLPTPEYLDRVRSRLFARPGAGTKSEAVAQDAQ